MLCTKYFYYNPLHCIIHVIHKSGTALDNVQLTSSKANGPELHVVVLACCGQHESVLSNGNRVELHPVYPEIMTQHFLLTLLGKHVKQDDLPAATPSGQQPPHRGKATAGDTAWITGNSNQCTLIHVYMCTYIHCVLHTNHNNACMLTDTHDVSQLLFVLQWVCILKPPPGTQWLNCASCTCKAT